MTLVFAMEAVACHVPFCALWVAYMKNNFLKHWEDEMFKDCCVHMKASRRLDTKHRTAINTLDVALFGDFCLLVCITNNMMPSRHRCQVSIFSRQHTGCDPCLWLFLSIVIIIFSAFSWSKTENDLVMQHVFVLFVLRFYGSLQLRSCRAGQLPINTVPGEASTY